MERDADRAKLAAELSDQARQLGGAECAKRERTWDECGIEEKVERLRAEQQDRRHMLDSAFTLARKAWDVVRGHQHGTDGRVLVDAERNENHGMLAGSRHDRLR